MIKGHEGSTLHQSGLHLPGWDWTSGGTKEDFSERIKHHNIPTHLSDIIWEHMRPVSQAETIHNKLTSLYDTPPSFVDFKRIISTKPSKSAGGFKELTYSQMKAWSSKFKRLVYDNLIPS